MSINFFQNFPDITYKNKKSKNLLVRAALREVIKQNTSVYLPLTLEDGERPDMIAQDLYGNAGYTWLIKFSNNIVDPYFDWLLTDYQFEQFLVKKYGSLENAHETILYYETISKEGYHTVTKDTYDLLDGAGKALYQEISAYEFETQKNEAKRNIAIISPEFSSIIANELEKKLND